MVLCYNTLAESVAMKVSRFALVCICGLGLMSGCAKTEDEPAQTNSKATTQPVTADNSKTQSESAEPAPTASMLMVGRAQQWFPPAKLRIETKDGTVVARLYSDDPKDVLEGKETVNSYDMKMTLNNISDPADISKAIWVDRSSSMEKQDHPRFGIFLDTEHEVLQPMNVTVSFMGKTPQVRAVVQGTFALFHTSDQMPDAAPEIVNVVGVLDATVDAK
jgi:hypothetical protein